MRVLDLFSGIGGFSLGLERAGMETVAFCEIEPFAQKVLKNHWPDVPLFHDVRALCRRIHHNLDETGENYDPEYVGCSIHAGRDFGDCSCIGTDEFTDRYGHIDLVAAGVPCQPASIIGKRKGNTDSRWLWPDTLRIVEQLEPSWVVCENPTGLLTLDGGQRFTEIIQRLEQAGYVVWWETIPASAVGAGHRRERVWIVAYSSRKGLEGHTGNGKVQRQAVPDRSTPQEAVFPLRNSGRWWQDQSPVPIVVDGVSDPTFWKEAVIATGNAVVPQVVEVIGRAIMEIERQEVVGAG